MTDDIKLKNGGRLVDVKAYFAGKINPPVVKHDRSTQTDIYDNQTEDLQLISHQFDPEFHSKLPKYMGILGVCVEAMETNVGGLGYDFIRRVPEKDMTDQERAEADEEYDALISLFDHINPDLTFIDLRRRMQNNKELTGFSAIEVIRDNVGDVREFHLIPSLNFFMTRRDDEFTDYDELIRNKQTGQYNVQIRRKRFRRYVQQINSKKIYFKEVGDPRPISAIDGKPRSGDLQANEVIFDNNYCNYCPYGIPRWVGNYLRILGHRKSEETNYFYFQNRAMPEYVIMVSGGHLTDASIRMLETRLEQLRGSENWGKPLVIEAEGEDIGAMQGESVTPVRIELKPLTADTITDALFQNYQKSAEQAVRLSFRLPPIFIGASEDTRYANALQSINVAENQVFRPERLSFDSKINRFILPSLGIKHWDFSTLGNKTVDDAEVAKALIGYRDAMTLEQINKIISRATGDPVEDPPEEYSNVPFIAIRTAITSAMSQDNPDQQHEQPDEEDVEPDEIDEAKKVIKAVRLLNEKLKTLKSVRDGR